MFSVLIVDKLFAKSLIEANNLASITKKKKKNIRQQIKIFYLVILKKQLGIEDRYSLPCKQKKSNNRKKVLHVLYYRIT